MSEGLRALMSAARSQPLDFRVSIYSGGHMITVRVAPSHWWYEVSAAARRAESQEVQQSGRGWGKRPAAPGTVAPSPDAATRFQAQLEGARSHEREDQDELTLVDVYVYPADFKKDTRTGARALPVARVPLSNVNLW